jgi:hypothetical protein
VEATDMNDVTSPSSQTAPASHERIAQGGKSIYGARIGVLMLDTDFPRIPGDIGNAQTWPFPMMFKVVRGATARRAVDQRAPEALAAFIAAGKELVADGAEALTTSCGFLTLYQKELSEACGVPVAASSLMQVPLVDRLLPPGKRAGILTIDARRLTPEHLAAAGIAPDTPIMGCEDGVEFHVFTQRGDGVLDCALAERDILEAGAELVRRHPEIGAIVMECTNMPPYAAALSAHVGLPVYTIFSFLLWFQAGLAPRGFGHPGSAR